MSSDPVARDRGSFDRRYVALLGSVIDAGRAALRDLEANEIPPRLARVARSTGKGLPGPLATSLLAEIDGSEWLREKTLAAFEEMAREDPAAEAFLRRDDGWWLTVAGALAGAAGTEATADLVRVRDEVASLRGRLGEAKQRERRLGRRIEALEGERAAAVEERSAPLRAAAERERRRAVEAEGRLAAATEAADAARADLAEAEERLGLLYERSIRLRAERADLERRLGTGDRMALPSDPIGIARWLDHAAGTLAPYRHGADAVGEAPTVPRAALALPAGVRPDQREAIDALRRLEPAWILVDGHNVLGAVSRRAIGDPAARRELIAGLGLLHRALSPAEVVVVFDSALGGGRESVTAAPGVMVRFSPATSAADDVLAEEVGELGPGTVVISNDREVQERTASAGALVLWADALVAWLSEARREGITTM